MSNKQTEGVGEGAGLEDSASPPPENTGQQRVIVDSLGHALETVGLCPDPHCTGEFYMPNAEAGESCPMEHDGDAPKLVIYRLDYLPRGGS